MLHDHATLTNETMQREFARLESVRIEFEARLSKEMENHESRITLLTKENEEWRSASEKKNLQIFTEVTNALKGLKAELNKEKKESLERDEVLKRDIQQQKEALEGLLKNLESHLA
jgi:hypothetical protein